MSSSAGFKWLRLRGDADSENTWNWRTWVLILAGLLALTLIITLGWALARTSPKEEPKSISQPPEPKADMSWLSAPQQYKKYGAPEPGPTSSPTAAPGVQQTYTAPAQPKAINEAILKSRASSFGEYIPGEESMFAASASGGAPCSLPAGTAVMAEVDTSISTDHPGAVRAIVTNDVSGYTGCLGIPAGSVMVGKPQGAANRAARRLDIAFNTLVVNGQSVSLDDAAVADTMGRGGMPAQRNMHMVSRLTAVAIATAVDLGKAALSDYGGYGPVLGNEGGTAIDQMAKEALNRPTTLTASPAENRLPITIILQKEITL